MVVVSLLAPARINRTTNIVVSLMYGASVVASIVGETWMYFILGSVVEVLLLLAIAGVALELAVLAVPCFRDLTGREGAFDGVARCRHL